MSELVVGLSKSAVVAALTKVKSATQDQEKLQQKAKRDLTFITLEFEMMHSFLSIANDEIRVKNALVGTWVKHVRDLAYDLEDCVEFVVHLDDAPDWWRRLLPSCIAPTLQLDQAVEEIQQLKSRVEDVNNCYRRYSVIHVDSATESMKPAIVYVQPAVVQPAASNMLVRAREASKRSHQVPGDLTQLISMTKKEDPLQVISIWGAGGDHGIASTIIKTYNQNQICNNFTCRAWVKLMHPFNPAEFIRNLMTQFYENSCIQQRQPIGVQVLTKMQAMQEDHLFQEFEGRVTQERYLVVLEDLQNMVEWHAINNFLPDMKKGSQIIVSTQEVVIASLCLGHSYQIFELERFSDEHSVCALFKRDAYVLDSGDNKGKNQMMIEEDQSSSYEEVLSLEKEKAKKWLEDNKLVGSQMDILRDYPAKTRIASPQVMCVWGIVGVGKSALVKSLYYEKMVLVSPNVEFDKYGWVDVSHPFNLSDLYRSLLSDCHSEKDPVEECRLLLKNYRCLIVIENLQSTEDWDLIKASMVSTHSKSAIIVITTEASLAAYCTINKDLMFNVKALKVDAALDLFNKKIKKEDILPSEDTELKQVILKCGGLPEVIVATASLLYSKPGVFKDKMRSLNSTFMHDLETYPEFGNLKGLFGCMHSIVLNPPAFLKPCIFYLSIFSQGQVIRRRRLVRRWIAEGYSRESNEMQAEEKAEMFFSELLDLSIFQQVSQLVTTNALNHTRMGFYQVNGFIREYIISRRMEENLVFELGGSCGVSTQSRGRHLIILDSWDGDKIVFENIDFSRLRSLTVFGKWKSFFISKSMKILRVLDLEDATGVTDGDLEVMVKLLQRLKFLSLRGCHEICNLPSSLGVLRHLQTLDVRGTSVVTLPVTITKLHELQYVRAGNTSHGASAASGPSNWLPKFCRRHQQVQVGVVVPGGIGKLKMLRTLGVVNVGASGGKAILNEIGKLTQTRKLGVSGINSHNSEGFFSAISCNGNLESLSVHLEKDNKCCFEKISTVDEQREPAWANLRSLKLYELKHDLPQWMSQLKNLSKLDLVMDTLKENGIESLGLLPKLSILRLCVKQAAAEGKISFNAEMNGVQLDIFENVKILEITCRSSNLDVTFGSESMQNLELLKYDCSSAAYTFKGLNSLPELKSVVLKGTSNVGLKKSMEEQLADHPRRKPTETSQTTIEVTLEQISSSSTVTEYA